MAKVPARFEPDVVKMRGAFDEAIRSMNAKGERFAHPIKPLSGLWGNTLYKYQHEDSLWAAPLGPLFNRIYGSENYQNIQECYGQAEIVLGFVRRLSLVGWKLGIASVVGHYWAVAKREDEPVFVHMDAWKEKFWTTRELETDQSFQAAAES